MKVTAFLVGVGLLVLIGCQTTTTPPPQLERPPLAAKQISPWTGNPPPVFDDGEPMAHDIPPGGEDPPDGGNPAGIMKFDSPIAADWMVENTVVKFQSALLDKDLTFVSHAHAVEHFLVVANAPKPSTASTSTDYKVTQTGIQPADRVEVVLESRDERGIWTDSAVLSIEQMSRKDFTAAFDPAAAHQHAIQTEEDPDPNWVWSMKATDVKGSGIQLVGKSTSPSASGPDSIEIKRLSPASRMKAIRIVGEKSSRQLKLSTGCAAYRIYTVEQSQGNMRVPCVAKSMSWNGPKFRPVRN